MVLGDLRVGALETDGGYILSSFAMARKNNLAERRFQSAHGRSHRPMRILRVRISSNKEAV
jgi:hypothetical protein